MIRRLIDRWLAPPAPPAIPPSAAGRALSARAHELRRSERNRQVQAHCAAILASMQPKEPAE